MSGFITSPRLAETVQLTILDVYLGKQWNLLRGLASSAPQCGHLILDRLISSSVRSCKHVLFSHLTIIPVLSVMCPLVSSMANAPSRSTNCFNIFLTRMQLRPFIWLIWQAIGIRSLLCGQGVGGAISIRSQLWGRQIHVAPEVEAFKLSLFLVFCNPSIFNPRSCSRN